VVGRNLGVRSRGAQERELQVAELLPVEHDGVQVNLQRLDEVLDIAHRDL
jgi:hypothetical protein